MTAGISSGRKRASMRHFHDRLLDTGDFVLTFELVPERLAQSRRLDRMLRGRE